MERSKNFHWFLGIAAFLIAGSAGFFSVFGLSKLFSGAALSVIIMAGSLEFGKLVTAAFLYRYWDKVSILQKFYLTVATIVLILITSGGIYGYLSNAYQGATVGFEKQSTKLLALEERLENLAEDKKFLKDDLEFQLKELPDNYRTAKRKLRESYNPQIQEVNQEVLDIKSEISDLELQLIDTGVDVGPAIYLAKVFKSDVDTVVSFFMLVLIFVFDPLAVMLVIAFNQALMIKEEESGEAETSSNSNITTGKKWWEMFGEKKPKKVAKVLDKLKNDDSDSGEILEPDIDDIPPVEEKTKEKIIGRGGVKVL
jgi:hypothetical protein